MCCSMTDLASKTALTKTAVLIDNSESSAKKLVGLSLDKGTDNYNTLFFQSCFWSGGCHYCGPPRKTTTLTVSVPVKHLDFLTRVVFHPCGNWDLRLLAFWPQPCCCCCASFIHRCHLMPCLPLASRSPVWKQRTLWAGCYKQIGTQKNFVLVEIYRRRLGTESHTMDIP